jgi:hypothetical protein
MTWAEAEGSTIPEVVPVEGQAPETQGAAGEAPELMEVASGEAPRYVLPCRVPIGSTLQ